MSLCLADGSRNGHQRRAFSSRGERKASPFSIPYHNSGRVYHVFCLLQLLLISFNLIMLLTYLRTLSVSTMTFEQQASEWLLSSCRIYKDAAATTDDVDAGHEPRRYSTRWDSGWTVSYCCRWRVLPQRRPRSSRSCHRRAPSLRRTWRLRYLNPSRCRFPPSSEPERHWHRHPSVTVRHWVNGIE